MIKDKKIFNFNLDIEANAFFKDSTLDTNNIGKLDIEI